MEWKSTRSALGGILFGALTGVTVGYLTAPRSGEQTRKMIKKNINESREQISAAVNEAGSVITSTILDARQHVSAVVDANIQPTIVRARKVGRISKQTMQAEVQTARRGINRAKKVVYS